MRRRVAAGIGFATIALATGAAAAVSTYHVTLYVHESGPNFFGKPCGRARGQGTFTYDDATRRLTGTVTHEVAPASTTILQGPPPNSYFAMSGSSPTSIDTTLAADGGSLPSENGLADGGFRMVVQANGADALLNGQLLPDDGGLVDICEQPDADAAPASTVGSPADPSPPIVVGAPKASNAPAGSSAAADSSCALQSGARRPAVGSLIGLLGVLLGWCRRRHTRERAQSR